MKNLIIVFLFVATLQTLLFCQIKSYNILTRDDLRYASIIKLSDIFQLIPQIDLYSTDGYRFKLNPGNNLTNSKNDIHIFINGTKIFQGLSETFNINHLPIHPEQIDSIIILNGSFFYKTEYLQGIILDFILKENKNTYSFCFTHSSGNEIGDPGSYLYTEYASENVDQVGPNTQAVFGYKNEYYSFNLNYLDRVFPATDSKILARVPKFIFENYQVRFFGASLDFSAKSFWGSHHIFTSYRKTGQAVTGFVYGSDLIFFEKLSKEIPVENSSFSLSLGNKINLTQNSNLSLDFNIGTNSFSNSKYDQEFIFHNKEQWFSSKIIFNHSFNEINISSGIEFLFNEIKEKSSYFQIKHNNLSFNSEINFSPLKNLNQTLSFSLVNVSNPIIYRLQLYNKYDFDKSTLSLKIFSGIKSNTFSNLLIPYVTEIPFEFSYLPKLNLIEAGYQQTLKKGNIINIDLSVQRETQLHLFLGSFNHYNDLNIISRNSIIEGKGLSLTKASLSLSFQDKLSDKISHRFYYQLEKVFSYDYLVLKFFRRIPPFRFNYSISFSPSNDLILSANLIYQGTKEYYEYKNINSTVNSSNRTIFSDKVDNSVLLNISLLKTFWKDKIRINASIYNLLNNEIQYHPLGGVMRLIFYLKGEIVI